MLVILSGGCLRTRGPLVLFNKAKYFSFFLEHITIARGLGHMTIIHDLLNKYFVT